MLSPRPCFGAAALMCLKKRKLYENQLEAVENNIMRVNEQQMMLENQRTTVETVAALSNAAKASKQTMHEMKIENVDKVCPSPAVKETGSGPHAWSGTPQPCWPLRQIS